MTQTSSDALHERLASLPQDRHVSIRSSVTSQGTIWRASWHVWKNGNRKTCALLLGKDVDGSIAQYIEEHQAYKRKPVPVRDVQGNMLLVDEAMAHFFTLPSPYKKIYVQEDGTRTLIDYNLESRTGHQPKYVKLETFIWETMGECIVPRTHEIVQKALGNDFCLGNLQQVRRARKEEVA